MDTLAPLILSTCYLKRQISTIKRLLLQLYRTGSKSLKFLHNPPLSFLMFHHGCPVQVLQHELVKRLDPTTSSTSTSGSTQQTLTPPIMKSTLYRTILLSLAIHLSSTFLHRMTFPFRPAIVLLPLIRSTSFYRLVRIYFRYQKKAVKI